MLMACRPLSGLRQRIRLMMRRRVPLRHLQAAGRRLRGNALLVLICPHGRCSALGLDRPMHLGTRA